MVGDESEQHRSGRRSRWVKIVLGVVGVLVVAVVVLVVLAARELSRPVPDFPSLADTPDVTLPGTVAYFGAGDCVFVVAAAGSPSKQVLCLPPFDPKDAESLGKPYGPQLAWRADGRLEVTMFRMSGPTGKGEPPTYGPYWQKVVDVRTGAVTDTATASLPTAPAVSGRPIIDPAGNTVRFTSNPESGHVTVTLTDTAGTTRTLLDERGPGSYTYGIDAAFFSPDFRSVYADDGRILVITLDATPVVRVLVKPIDMGLDPSQSRFAVTGQNLLG